MFPRDNMNIYKFSKVEWMKTLKFQNVTYPIVVGASESIFFPCKVFSHNKNG